MTEENNEDELTEVDVWEFSLDSEEIDELTEKLKELKENKNKVSFEIDEENELLIHYEETEDGGAEDE